MEYSDCIYYVTKDKNHARKNDSPFPIRTSDAGKIKRNRNINFPSKENMMECFKNRSFLEDGNGFFDCVFTQSVENGCQNKENYWKDEPTNKADQLKQLISYQFSSFSSH